MEEEGQNESYETKNGYWIYFNDEEVPLEDKYHAFLDKFAKTSPDLKTVDILLKDEDIWAFLEEAVKKGHITAAGVTKLIHFRRKAFDTFLLVDQDFDGRVSQFFVDSDLDWQEGDIDEEFIELFESLLPDPLDDQKFEKWRTSFI